MPTWAVTLDYRIEEEIRKAQEPEDTGEIGTLDQRRRADPKRRRRRSGRASHRHQQNLRRGVQRLLRTHAYPRPGGHLERKPLQPDPRAAPTKVRSPRQSHSRPKRQRSQRTPRRPRRPRKLPQPRRNHRRQRLHHLREKPSCGLSTKWASTWSWTTTKTTKRQSRQST